MDQILAAIQEAALQQHLCNTAGGMQLPFMQLPFPLCQQPMMKFAGGYSQYGNPTQSAHDVSDLVEDEDEDDEEQIRTLFCNNLDERVSEEILYEVFLQAGPIENVRIPLDNAGRQRNFGFVTYQHKSAVPYAVDLYQGLELFQKKLTIRQQCVEKPKHQQGRSRNPFSQDFATPAAQGNEHGGAPRHARHSMHDINSHYAQNKYNNDLRRRSDSAVVDRNRPRAHQQQQHNNSGGNRRSDQRYNHGKRRLI
ncbi:RNA-binding protein 7 [Drosophila grimshawi]|uniref:GH10062 n=1 Tax=Drosophila grimshawi TaxID=7222 RepID=B4JD44_DROGR|nr:RNA-binding protein 7 [Drosophila grimshawi]EDW04288.1 GH10062 [Drosophila grimshawi]